MKKYLQLLAGAALLVSAAQPVNAQGWPANYEGVMLQGFYWDSYDDTKWTNLEAQADELSQYFKLIWVPNSGKCAYMGYMPQYWFTNHNSAFGSEAELRSMIATYKDKGTGIIEDVVINHRNGVTNWHDFPVEKWNGRTWSIGLDGICGNDEMAYAAGQPKPTGNNDTGDNFDGCRDLDHTNANVQDNCKNYCKFLLEDLGYSGFRYDMVKGYGGQYTKIYNQYSKPRFSVGEYWDGQYDAVAGWIESTGKTSAAFDFPGKYAINEAFHSNDLTKLVWMANGSNPQPAGLIHFGYSQYAVTFIDNHDTYRDGSKFNGNVVAANAFILCSPGTPCVFLPHYQAHKAEIQALINVRNSVGVHNNSAVKVLRTDASCYMAEVTGSKGKLVVKIGSAMVSPDGYANSDIKATGNDYCVWAKVTGGNQGGGEVVSAPADIYFDNSKSKWTTPHIYYWGDTEPTWPGVAMTKVEGDIWHFQCPKGTSGILFNAGDGDATKTGDFVPVDKHVYTTSGDQGQYTGGSGGGSGDDNDDTDPLKIFFDNTASGWATPYIYYWGASEPKWPGVAMERNGGNIWVYTCPAGTTGILFNAGDGDASKTGDFVAVNNHVYTTFGDQGVFNGGSGDDPVSLPKQLYILGDLKVGAWTTDSGVEMEPNTATGCMEANGVQFVASGTNEVCYFNIASTLGEDWNAINSANRYGAAEEGVKIAEGIAADVVTYVVNINASACKSWTIAPGIYDVALDWGKMKLTVKQSVGAVDAIESDGNEAPVYYNLQGVKVDTPSAGLYIVRRGAKVTKEIIR